MGNPVCLASRSRKTGSGDCKEFWGECRLTGVAILYQVLSFYRQKLGEVLQRLAAVDLGTSADPTSPSADLDADLEKLSDLAGVRLSKVFTSGIRHCQ